MHASQKQLFFSRTRPEGVSQEKPGETSVLPEKNTSIVSLVSDLRPTSNHPSTTKHEAQSAMTTRLMNISSDHHIAQLEGVVNSSRNGCFVVSLLQKKTPTAGKIGTQVSGYRTIEEAKIRGSSD